MWNKKCENVRSDLPKAHNMSRILSNKRYFLSFLTVKISCVSSPKYQLLLLLGKQKE